jgi:hypothetical protein
VLEKIANPLGFSKSLGSPQRAPAGRRAALRHPAGRPAQGWPEPALGPEAPDLDALSGLLPEEPAAHEPEPDGLRLEPLVAEWLRDLQIQGRSQQTIDWYRHKLRRYLAVTGTPTNTCVIRASGMHSVGRCQPSRALLGGESIGGAGLNPRIWWYPAKATRRPVSSALSGLAQRGLGSCSDRRASPSSAPPCKANRGAVLDSLWRPALPAPGSRAWP